jgi:Putative transposase
VLSRLFRRLFLAQLAAAHDTGRVQFFGDHAHLAGRRAFTAYLAPLRRAERVVYSKRPPELLSKGGGPEAVLAYLSRYTHRIAIANSRLVAFDGDRATFRWKDYRAKSAARYKLMTLDPTQPRRAATATTPRVLTKTNRGTLPLLRRAHDHCRDLRTRLPAPALAPPNNRARQLVTNTLLSPSPSLRRSDADISPATPTRGQRQSSTPPSTAKTQIIQCNITISVASAVLNTTVAALAQPPFPFESEKSDQTPALNLHSLTPPPVRTPPRFLPSRLFGRLPPCIPSRLRPADIRKALTIAAICRTEGKSESSREADLGCLNGLTVRLTVITAVWVTEKS